MWIMAEEDAIVELGGIQETSTEPLMDLVLVGKVVTIRPYIFEALKKTLNQIWTISKVNLFRQIENGFFVIQFSSVKDKSKVMTGRP